MHMPMHTHMHVHLPQVFPPGELCPGGSMYIVSRGIALHATRVYRTGTVWGADILLAHPLFQQILPAIAMS